LTSDGTAVEADRFVACAGPWITEFVDLPVTVTRQSFTYIRARHTGPVWIEDGPNNLYGFPVEEPSLDRVKIAAHHPGPAFDPEAADRLPAVDDPDEALDFVRRRWGIAEPEVVEQGVCLYTTTADEQFRIGRLDHRSFYASPCSGHGFKFGPWIGTLMANFVDGSSQVEDFPSFR
jgi:sarcosine oxidase